MTRHRMPFGADVVDDGVHFSLYAPDVDAIDLLIDGRPEIRMIGDNGYKRAHVRDARAGDLYNYRLPDGVIIPDPASRFQPQGVTGPSEIIDPQSYVWRNKNWRGRPWNEAVLYETHIGAATEQGTYHAFADRLGELANLGVTLIELMPLAQWRGQRNWGYDGVLPFAPANSYGRPEDLKALVDKAHGLGLMIVIDVVYNHFGPSGNYLNNYARSFFTQRHVTPWGEAINYDDEGRDATRAFFTHNALYWVEEFNVDGLRLDAVHSIHDHSDKHILVEIAQSVRDACPDRHIHLFLENDENQARWLAREQDTITPRFYTAQWNDDAHHCWHTLLSGEQEGYYIDFADDAPARLARALTQGFAYQGDKSIFRKGEPRGERSSHLPPTAFIDFLQNHDQIGNRAFGERIDALVAPERLAMAREVLLLSPHIPMLFMGEEWASSKPFLYFVDFADEPELARAVFEGRRNEFAGFADFGTDKTAIPDPNALETFLQTRIVLEERALPPHNKAYERTHTLLQLRRSFVAPLLATGYRGASQNNSLISDLIDLSWRFEAGTLRIAMNIGAADVETPVADGAIFYASDAVERGTGSIRLPPWSMMAIRS